MYRGFNVKFTSIQNSDLMSRKYRLRHFEDNKSIRATFVKPIESYLTEGMNFDAELIRQGWFPSEMVFDIFISHSGNDKKNAFALADWLERTFGLSCFIDSLVWSHYESLQEKLDDFYAKKYKSAYDEKFRYRVYQNIDLMLNTSLMEVMDKCECLFFLNTPRSIQSDKMHQYLTDSPWLFSEISMFNHIEKPKPLRRRSKVVGYCEAIESKILHPLDLSNLVTIDSISLNKWKSLKNEKEHPLDILYKYVDRRAKL